MTEHELEKRRKVAPSSTGAVPSTTSWASVAARKPEGGERLPLLQRRAEAPKLEMVSEAVRGAGRPQAVPTTSRGTLC